MSNRSAIVIPGKGTSVRIIDKNLSMLGGTTLVARAMYKALGIGMVDVFLSTESDRVAEEAPSNVTVLRRPTDMPDNFYDVMRWEMETHLSEYEKVFHLHCTAPFLTSKTIQRFVNVFRGSHGCKSLFTTYSEPLFMWSSGPGTPSPLYDAYKLPRSQEIEQICIETHGMYGVCRKSFLEENHRYPYPCTFSISKLEAFDINDQTDLSIARAIEQASTRNS